jgi:hypothetical protein
MARRLDESDWRRMHTRIAAALGIGWMLDAFEVQIIGSVIPGILALLTDPWGFGSAGQYGSVAAEGEHGWGDERVGGVESERDAGQEPDLGVGGFDQSLGQAVLEGGVNRVAVSNDAARHFDKHPDATAPRPRDPPVQRLFSSSPLTENTCRRPSLSR